MYMKTSQFKLKKVFSYNTFGFKHFLTCLLIVLCTQSIVNATVTSYSWTNDYRGYSIEQVPGTSGTNAEFVAVGSILDKAGHGINGFHFIHLDYNGHIMDTRTTWCNAQILNAVDIVAEDNGSGYFWIVLQVRDELNTYSQGSTSFGYDYIYAIKVNKAGNTASSLPNEIKLRSGFTLPIGSCIGEECNYRSLYPTHSVFYTNPNTGVPNLFLCGYAGFQTEYNSINPSNEPFYAGKKYSFLIRCDLSSPTVATQSYFWNTINPTGVGVLPDYDEPLRMSVDRSNSDRPSILLTGACNASDTKYSNTGGNVSAILAMDFSYDVAGLYPVRQTGIYQYPTPPTGMYGVDIFENKNKEVYFLANYYDEGSGGCHPYAFGYGVGKLDNLLQPPSYTGAPLGFLPSFMPYYNSQFGNNFANQFFLDPNQSTAPGFSMNLTIVGQQYNVLCSTTAAAITAPNLVPGTSNVNPFVDHSSYTGSSTLGLMCNANNHKVHLSVNGTNALAGAYAYNYLSGTNTSLGCQRALEDISRLYTFSGQVDNNLSSDLFMLNPMANSTTTQLNFKYTRLNSLGDETDCNNQVTDCDPVGAPAIGFRLEKTGTFVPVTFRITTAFTPVMKNSFNDFPIESNCALGSYKAAGIAIDRLSAMSVSLNPNPATNNTNLDILLTETVDLNIIVTDMIGRKVADVYTGRNSAGAYSFNINTTTMDPGFYIVCINGGIIQKAIKLSVIK